MNKVKCQSLWPQWNIHMWSYSLCDFRSSLIVSFTWLQVEQEAELRTESVAAIFEEEVPDGWVAFFARSLAKLCRLHFAVHQMQGVTMCYMLFANVCAPSIPSTHDMLVRKKYLLWEVWTDLKALLRRLSKAAASEGSVDTGGQGWESRNWNSLSEGEESLRSAKRLEELWASQNQVSFSRCLDLKVFLCVKRQRTWGWVGTCKFIALYVADFESIAVTPPQLLSPSWQLWRQGLI